MGYRIESEDGIVAYLCDHEPALGLPNGRWPSSDWISGYDIAMDADLLIHDAQYTDEEYARCADGDTAPISMHSNLQLGSVQSGLFLSIMIRRTMTRRLIDC